MFHYATILTYFSSIVIVAVNDVGRVKMYETNSTIIITFFILKFTRVCRNSNFNMYGKLIDVNCFNSL